MRKYLFALLFAMFAGPALAQNVTCPTRPTGDSSNACASTAFVQGQFTNFLASNNTWTGHNTFSGQSAISTSWAGPYGGSYSGINDQTRFITNNFPQSGEFGGGTVPIVQTFVVGLAVPSTASGGNNADNAIAGYCSDASGAQGCAAVSGFGYIAATPISGATGVWGLVGLVTNCGKQNCTTNSGFTTGNLYAEELDTNLMLSSGIAPAINVRGLWITGGSETQSDVSHTFNAIEVGQAGYTTPTPWRYVLYTDDLASSGTAINLGAQGLGNNVGCQGIALRARNSSGTASQSNIGCDSNGDLVLDAGGSGALAVLGDGVTNFQKINIFGVTYAGNAPVCSATGAGTGASCAAVTGSNDINGTLAITAGTTPSSSGGITITFSGSFGTNSVACLVIPANLSTGNWSSGAIIITTGASTTSNSFFWSNNATNLIATDIYDVNYHCSGF